MLLSIKNVAGNVREAVNLGLSEINLGKLW